MSDVIFAGYYCFKALSVTGFKVRFVRTALFLVAIFASQSINTTILVPVAINRLAIVPPTGTAFCCICQFDVRLVTSHGPISSSHCT
jgi:hypothetical protein